MDKKKKVNKELIPIHIYGIFDVKNRKVIKVSLDLDEIEMDMSLEGNNEDLKQCEFKVMLAP